MKIIDRSAMDALFEALKRRGFRLVGPTVREDVIVYDEVNTVTDLPVGYTDEHGSGSYRVNTHASQTLFGYVVGPESWRKFLHPPVMRLWQAKRNGTGGWQITAEHEEPAQYAFIGVRSCELHAISIQDAVFTQQQYVDASYQSRREKIFIVAVNCTVPGSNCFCASMNTGPKVTSGYDLALTEVLDAGGHYFAVEVGTPVGAEVLSEIPHQNASRADEQIVESMINRAGERMGKSVDTTDIKDLLYRNSEHPQWDDVASRCLTCANCTMVCPTCFCSTVEDVTDLTGEHAERWRKWDSCFTMDFSYVHGGSVRASSKARYRQWLTHKLAFWIDEFGTSGCVGCGRCITWCPAGIDITQEVRAIRGS